jgi:hypothetical protein
MALAIFFLVLLLSTGFVAAGWYQTWHLVSASQRTQHLRWLVRWSVKGLAVPMLIWCLMNVGLSWQVQAFMPQIQMAQNKGGVWFPTFLRVMAGGLFVVSTYWTATTLGWSLIRAAARLEGDARADFRVLCTTCFLGMLLPGLLFVWLGGWAAAGLAVMAMMVPMAGYAPGILNTVKTPPLYGSAIAKMKFGKYGEAEWEIIRQLEKCDTDFEGWMMMADLYANHFHDLGEAEQTIVEICSQPATTAPQLSVALHKLADWYLNLAEDPEAARRALQVICDRLPATHLAHMAQLRMNQLPQNKTDLREQRVARAIPLPALGDALDEEEKAEPADSKTARAHASQAANSCVEKLNRDPNDVQAREKLARLLAEQLGKVELGIEQLALLLDMPEQADTRRAEWLAMIAAWQIRIQDEPEAGRKTLERLVEQFPHTPQAFAARRRIMLLQAEARRREAAALPNKPSLS